MEGDNILRSTLQMIDSIQYIRLQDVCAVYLFDRDVTKIFLGRERKAW